MEEEDKPKKKSKKQDEVPEYKAMYPEARQLTIMERRGTGFVPIGMIDEIEKTIMGTNRNVMLFDGVKKKFVRKFDEPLILWEQAKAYFEWATHHPWRRNEAIKSGPAAGEILSVETSRPYYKPALLVFLGITPTTWKKYKTDEEYEDFHEVCEFIDMVIESQNFEGAAVGAFNANMMSRVLGLAEKKEVENKGTVTHHVAGVTIL